MKNKNVITRCLFPAAGYGTRFLPATKAMPKEMLPVLTKPLIQYGVEEAMDAGCDVMSIITGRGKRAITGALADRFASAFGAEAEAFEAFGGCCAGTGFFFTREYKNASTALNCANGSIITTLLP